MIRKDTAANRENSSPRLKTDESLSPKKTKANIDFLGIEAYNQTLGLKKKN